MPIMQYNRTQYYKHSMKIADVMSINNKLIILIYQIQLIHKSRVKNAGKNKVG